MNEVKWIKITTDIFDDEKIKLIDSMPDRDTLLVIWFKLLAMAGKTNDRGLVYIIKEIPTTDEMLATIFNRPINTVRLALKTFSDFEMIEINKHINIVNWDKHQNVDGLDKIREQARLRQARYREKQKNLLEDKSNVTVTSSNSLDIEEDLDEEKDVDGEKKLDTSNKKEILFEEWWNIYNVKGRGSKSVAKKQFIKLTLQDIELVKKHTDYYVKNTEQKYRKNGDRYLRERIFECEIENKQDTKPSIDTKIVNRIGKIEMLLDTNNIIYEKDKLFLEETLTDDRYSKYRYILDKIDKAEIV